MCTHIEWIFCNSFALNATGKVQIMFGVDSFDSWKAKLEHNKGLLGRHDKKMTKHEKMSLDYIKFLYICIFSDFK